MRLEEIQIQNFGPFLDEKLIIDPEVTVITGSNDAGKSRILELIDLLYSQETATFEQVNIYRNREATKQWDKDAEIRAFATLTLNEDFKTYVNVGQSGATTNQKIRLEKHLTTGKIRSRFETSNVAIIRFPNIIHLPQSSQFNNVIGLQTTQPHERAFIDIAFGANAQEKINALPNWSDHYYFRNASTAINEKLYSFIPNSMGIEFRLDPILKNNDDREVSVNIIDRYFGETPVHYRGSGVQKIINMMIQMVTLPSNEYLIILADEPETSLHADSQHRLRYFLEKLATNDHIQVIYATHSPSMINNFKNNGLRLLKRVNRENKAITVIENDPVDKNFLAVRSSLGISPADSLLYSPITILTEGKTEVLCIPILLEKLRHQGISGFENIHKLMSITHLIATGGGQAKNIIRWCDMVESHGETPIIFVDGDMIKKLKATAVQAKIGHVKTIYLTIGEEKIEFEDIVPKEIYFTAMRNMLGEESLTLEAFKAWIELEQLSEYMMFSKQVDRWLKTQFSDKDINYDKPDVMVEALRLVEGDKLEDLHLDQFVELVEAMQEIADSL